MSHRVREKPSQCMYLIRTHIQNIKIYMQPLKLNIKDEWHHLKWAGQKTQTGTLERKTSNGQ